MLNRLCDKPLTLYKHQLLLENMNGIGGRIVITHASVKQCSRISTSTLSSIQIQISLKFSGYLCMSNATDEIEQHDKPSLPKLTMPSFWHFSQNHDHGRLVWVLPCISLLQLLTLAVEQVFVMFTIFIPPFWWVYSD